MYVDKTDTNKRTHPRLTDNSREKCVCVSGANVTQDRVVRSFYGISGVWK